MQATDTSLRLPLVLAVVLLAAMLLILSVAGWMQYGSSIFLVMADGTLAWCL